MPKQFIRSMWAAASAEGGLLARLSSSFKTFAKKGSKEGIKNASITQQFAEGMKKSVAFKYGAKSVKNVVGFKGYISDVANLRFRKNLINTTTAFKNPVGREISLFGKTAMKTAAYIPTVTGVVAGRMAAGLGRSALAHPKTTLGVIAVAGTIHGMSSAAVQQINTRTSSKRMTGRHHMGSNHLSTDGLTLGLSRTRHR